MIPYSCKYAVPIGVFKVQFLDSDGSASGSGETNREDEDGERMDGTSEKKGRGGINIYPRRRDLGRRGREPRQQPRRR